MSAKLSNPTPQLQPHGVHWSDGLYLTTTSAIDGWQRWQEIVLLLASKIQTNGEEISLSPLNTYLLKQIALCVTIRETIIPGKLVKRAEKEFE